MRDTKEAIQYFSSLPKSVKVEIARAHPTIVQEITDKGFALDISDFGDFMLQVKRNIESCAPEMLDFIIALAAFDDKAESIVKKAIEVGNQ